MSEEIRTTNDPASESQHQLVDEELGEVMNTYSVVLMYEDGNNRVIRGIEAATPDDAVLIVSIIERLDMSEFVGDSGVADPTPEEQP